MSNELKKAKTEDLTTTSKKSYMEQVANMLGVELYEEFKVKPTGYGKALGYKGSEYTFRFDPQLSYKGHHDGWSEWYCFDCEKTLYYLLLGIYEIDFEIEEEAEKDE